MNSKEKDSQNDPNKAEEPKLKYGEKTISFFDSVEEMNENQYQQYAEMTPKERLQMFVKCGKPFGLKNQQNPMDVIYI